MANEPRIAVITHAIDRFDRGGYVLNALIDQWKSRAMKIVISRGPGDPPPQADLAIVHIDLTRVGDEYARMFDSYRLVINRQVRNISKSAFSEQIIGRDDPYDGPVIVKTDNNFGGMRELQLRHLGGDPGTTLEIQRPWRKIEFLPAYPVFSHPNHVPPGVWRNPSLVVEKFRPERTEDGEYALRMWVFLGDRGIYYQSFSAEPIVKGKNTIRRVVLDASDVPQSLRNVRERLGFDYGKFDFGMVDGEAVLYDVNRTPAIPGDDSESRKITRLYPILSEGLDCFVPRLQLGNSE